MHLTYCIKQQVDDEMIVMYRRLNKQRSIFTSSQALMKAIYLDYKKFEIGGAKSVKKRKVILM